MQQITEFRTALAENDQDTIIRMLESKVSVTETYDLRCDAEDCECLQKVSVCSYIENGHAKPEALKFLLEQKYVGINVVCGLTHQLFRLTGTGEADDFQQCDKCVDVLLDYLNSKDSLREAAVAFRDEDNSTLFHSVFYGHAPRVRIAGWAERLFSMGFDPYAPLRNNEQRPLDMIIGHLHVKLAEQTVNLAVVNYYEYNQYWRGANTLQRLLKTYATAKDSETLVKVHQMVKILVNSNINLEFTDADGLSITDYLSEYKWIDTDVGLLFYGKYMPALSGKKYVNPYKRLGRKINPSPFADYMFRERYTKGQNDRLAADIRALVAIHGVPTPLEWIAHGECGPVCEKCSDSHMCGFDSLEELARKFGFNNIEVIELIDPSYT